MIDEKKTLLYEKQAEVAKAVAHPLRIAIVDFLKDGEKCVCDISEHVASERSNVSKHLSILVNAGILDGRKDGLKVIYRLKCRCVLDFVACVTEVVKHVAEENDRLLSAL
jgi:DNA-binding transcriptional ArsR family regulator